MALGGFGATPLFPFSGGELSVAGTGTGALWPTPFVPYAATLATSWAATKSLEVDVSASTLLFARPAPPTHTESGTVGARYTWWPGAVGADGAVFDVELGAGAATEGCAPGSCAEQGARRLFTMGAYAGAGVGIVEGRRTFSFRLHAEELRTSDGTFVFLPLGALGAEWRIGRWLLLGGGVGMMATPRKNEEPLISVHYQLQLGVLLGSPREGD